MISLISYFLFCSVMVTIGSSGQVQEHVLSGMPLIEVVDRMESGGWSLDAASKYATFSGRTLKDNVGLLTEPSEPIQVKKILVTNDLTESVLEEAMQMGANMIISYHPAIIDGFRRLTQRSDWKAKLIIKCIEQRIAVYSPHTIWDDVYGGINDWILEAFGNNTINVHSVHQTTRDDKPFGLGRVADLKKPLKMSTVIKKLKSHLGMETFQIALANNKTFESVVSSMAVGAGGGSGLLNDLSIDLIVTGEFLHHEILHENHRGVSIIVTDHSNTERGYIPKFIADFTRVLEQSKKNGLIEITQSKLDRDPLEFV